MLLRRVDNLARYAELEAAIRELAPPRLSIVRRDALRERIMGALGEQQAPSRARPVLLPLTRVSPAGVALAAAIIASSSYVMHRLLEDDEYGTVAVVVDAEGQALLAIDDGEARVFSNAATLLLTEDRGRLNITANTTLRIKDDDSGVIAQLLGGEMMMTTGKEPVRVEGLTWAATVSGDAITLITQSAESARLIMTEGSVSVVAGSTLCTGNAGDVIVMERGACKVLNPGERPITSATVAPDFAIPRQPAETGSSNPPVLSQPRDGGGGEPPLAGGGGTLPGGGPSQGPPSTGEGPPPPMGESTDGSPSPGAGNQSPGQEVHPTPPGQDGGSAPGQGADPGSPDDGGQQTPPGHDEAFVPPRQGEGSPPPGESQDPDPPGTPPGQDGEVMPPGQSNNPNLPAQDGDHTPPAQDDDFSPPGQQGASTPPGLENHPSHHGAPGQEGDQVPPGQQNAVTPPDQASNATPPGHQSASTQPGRENNPNLPAQAPAITPRGHDDDSVPLAEHGSNAATGNGHGQAGAPPGAARPTS